MCSKRHCTSIMAWKHMTIDKEVSSVDVGYLGLQHLASSGPHIPYQS